MTRIFKLFFRLLALAGGLMVAAAVMTKLTRPSRGGPESDDIDLVTIWGGKEIASTATSFRGGSILTWWGGTELDLRRATLDHDWAYLSIRTIFGGTSITVPPNWRVEVRGRAIAGGIDQPREAATDLEGPLVDIDALAVFGGISVTRKALDEE